MESTPGKIFYDKQIAALESNDLDALAMQYAPDAVLIGFDFTIQGRDAIRQHMSNYLAHLGTLKLKSTDKFTETSDSIFFEATIVTSLGEAKVYDVLILRNNQATHHFTGVISVSPRP